MKIQPKLKLSIVVKATIVICLAMLSIMAVGVVLGYFAAFNLLRDTIVENRQETARVASGNINENVAGIIRSMNVYLSSPFWKNAVINSNLKYENMKPEGIQNYLLDMDKKWVEEPSVSLMVEGYLDNEMSLRLKALVKADDRMAEMILTDKFGGLAAASGRTTDFYQADEPWWQEVFNDGKGKGKVYIGNVEYDQSSGEFGVAFAVSVRDEMGNVIGVCKNIVKLESLFEGLKDIKIGKTGHAGAINEKGYTLFHEGTKQLSVQLFSEKDINEVLINNKRWLIPSGYQFHPEKMLVVFSRVEHHLLLDKGIVWIVFIEQEVKEAFSNLKILILQGFVLCAILLGLLVPIGIIFSRMLVKPIKKIQKAIEYISAGNLEYKIGVETNDEIGQLAGSFNQMAGDLKKSQDIIEMNTKELEAKVARRTKELDNLNLNLEGRVKERTAELAKSQTAMLYMIEDLNRQAKEIKDAQDKVIRSEKLAVIGQLASSVAHELRNPLGVMKNVVYYFNMLGLGKDNADIKENLDILSKEIEGSNKIIGDLLEFSRVKKPVLRLENINVIIREVINRLKVPEGVKIIIELADNLPDIKVDALQIQQVFYNIASNGIQVMEKGG
ncbi:MAG: HAMP domain-containing protein, partial [Candidatus Omnitrophota bacterium]